MKLVPQSPKIALKAFIKQKPLRSEIDVFKANLINLLDKINIIEHRPKDESEEHLKNDLRDFLRDTYYREVNAINTKDKKDLVIHLGKQTSSDVAVIIEAKRPTNVGEMITAINPNKKALHELILYYLDERFHHTNKQLKHLVITNIHEWYIIDANSFDKHIARNSQIKKLYDTKVNDKKDNPFFYEEIAKIIDKIDADIPCVFFDIRQYDSILRNHEKEDDRELSALFKILSPQHLLKIATPNDSNSLNEKFYKELLHIIGLEEAKESGKTIIRRKKDNRNAASLIEATIEAIHTEDVLHRIPDITIYGESKEERIFTIALELCITWINRCLFLKLLEGQLVAYHKDLTKNLSPLGRGRGGLDDFHFLNTTTIHDFDELFKLFHKVLAVHSSNRSEAIIAKYSNIPYLNSSLFEISELEDHTVKINSLDNSGKLELMKGSVLTSPAAKPLHLERAQNGESLMPTLQYLFQFLDAYDFASDSTDDVQDDSKTIINASVLGKVFEKINGYKDGSIYTPGFITMYMCRKAIRLSVVQKFKDTYGWNIDTFDDIKNYLADRRSAKDILEFNSVINSLRLCDPAVGSGHYLVSALNEFITIKYELGIFADSQGNRIRDYSIEIVNDELLVTDYEGNIFEYKMQSGKPLNTAIQQLQKTLFHEKQTIIENCLFGVDINPNSVKICRLRLWIELLKSAYYKEVANTDTANPPLNPLRGGDFELETLPNIDINIKCGNSLLSRFALDADLSKALKSVKYDIKAYRGFVDEYKNCKSREVKRELQRILDSIKNDFRTEINKNDPKVQRLSRVSGELFTLLNQTSAFELTEKEKKDQKAKQLKLEAEITKLTHEIEDIKSNAIYKNAFEWRFEFPEVLNNNGDFEGFDVVVGNPPYMRVQEIEKTQPAQKLLYELKYQSARGAFDLANLFFELAVSISKLTANNAFIFPHKFLNSDSGTAFRDYLKEGMYIDRLAHFGANMIFDNADTYTCIAQFSKKHNEGIYFQRFPYKSDYRELIFNDDKFQFLSYHSIKNASTLYGANNWMLFDNEIGFRAFEKIYEQKAKIQSKFEIFVGLQTSKDEIYVLDVIEEKENTFSVRVPLDNQEIEIEKHFFKPFLMGKEVHRFEVLSPKRVVFFPYKLDEELSLVTEKELETQFPLTYNYLKSYEDEFKKRESGKAGKMKCWYAYIYPKNLNKFEQVKLSSMEICSIHPNVTLNTDNLYHTTKVYSWVKSENTKEDYKFFLAIANSSLLWWFLKNTGDTLQGDARTFKTNYLNPFPLPESVSPKAQQPFITLVDQILAAKQAGEDTSVLEGRIDEFVYALYGLTEEEIAVVSA